jgi:hypothetical protein
MTEKDGPFNRSKHRQSLCVQQDLCSPSGPT